MVFNENGNKPSSCNVCVFKYAVYWYVNDSINTGISCQIFYSLFSAQLKQWPQEKYMAYEAVALERKWDEGAEARREDDV